ncbi:hypothetical protein [Sulfuracidifex tepidarius]|uniref:Uncharacterized protein n=1 Tax=Sulfuracidifex tepidarius TaxID=1294262 RepID=A0A510E1D3_9CREN|nr:hypothetical protein [Sulfuracidifex tepidarius]BBG23547.1 hypothetical protein IC006_0831 [Sulfuracidifex tepidarius]BBG26301.1 hypothetical protein IC007_0806 [Sulfuracidifex tepidarius]
MNRVRQLTDEAIEEIEKYNSCQSAYYILKTLSEGAETLCKEKEVKYDYTVDNLIIMSLYTYEDVTKARLFVTSFIIYDLLAKKYTIQNPLFYFRWNKRYFVYSPRIESHLSYLSREGFVKNRKKYSLTEYGKKEGETSLATLNKETLSKIQESVSTLKRIETMKQTKVFLKKYLMGYREE